MKVADQREVEGGPGRGQGTAARLASSLPSFELDAAIQPVLNMRPLVALLIASIALAVAAPLADAHVTKTVGAYSMKVGWSNEPALAQERNDVTVFVYNTATGAGVTGLGTKLQVTVLHSVENRPLNMQESGDAPGNYSATIIPTEPGLYKIRVQGFIENTQVSSDFDIENVQDPGDLAFPRQGSGGTGVTVTDLQNEFQQLRTDVDNLQAAERERANRIPSAGALGAIVAIAGAAMLVAIARRR